MRIGELAGRTGLSRDTIRFYEKQGLIRSEANSAPSNNYRSYSEDTVLTLELVREAQDAGFTIADLSMFISQLHAEAPEDFDGIAFLQRKIEEIEARIARSRKFLKTLQQTKAALLRDDPAP